MRKGESEKERTKTRTRKRGREGVQIYLGAIPKTNSKLGFTSKKLKSSSEVVYEDEQ